MYLTASEFEKFARSAKALVGGELHKEQLEEAIALGSAQLDTLLNARYETPLSLNSLPSTTQAIIKRWCKYMSLENLLGMTGLAIDREVRSALLDIIQQVREEIEAHVQSAAQLTGVPVKNRITGGVSDVAP